MTVKKSNELTDIVVYTPVKLEEKDKSKARNLIEKLTGEKVEQVTFKEDESILDGIKIIYKDKLWDFSLQKELQSITE